MEYDMNMSIQKVNEYSNEILKFTSESSNLYAKLEQLKKLINSIDDSWTSGATTKVKNAFFTSFDSFKAMETVLNSVGKLSLDISEMRKNTEIEIEKIVNDLS